MFLGVATNDTTDTVNFPTMNDSEIRAAFHEKHLRTIRLGPDTVIIDELGLLNGQVRADIAVVNGSLIGYEIKGPKDDLSRLDSQIRGYDSIFDKTSVIAASKFLPRLHERLPGHWGILEIVGNGQIIDFEIIRPAKRNPCVDPMSLARLLWKSEMEEFLSGTRLNRRAIRRSEMSDLIVSGCSIDTLRDYVRRRLRDRIGWRDRKQPSRYGGLFRSTAMCSSFPALCCLART